MEELNQLKDTYLPVLIEWGMNIIWAIVILIIGWAASSWFAKRVERWLDRTERISQTLDPFLIKFTRAGILAIVFLMVLNRFGIETASVIAVLGTIGLAIGLALQGSLSNVASGLMILGLRPFKVGDVVNVKGRTAVIDEIGVFVTEMHTLDNIALHITNTKVWEDIIENHSQNATRRVDMVFGVGYDDDLDHVFKVIKDVLDADERVLTEPAPFIGIQNLDESWVSIYVRPWASSDDHFQVEVDLQKKIKERFDEEGISMPFPTQDLKIVKEDKKKV